MKKAILLFIALGIIITTSLIPIGKTFSNATQPPAGYTGAPGEKTCVTSGCHTTSSGTQNDNNILFTSLYPALDASDGYDTSTLYSLSINAGNGEYNIFGFEITAVDSVGNGIGTFAITDSSHTSLTTLKGRQYMGHKNASSQEAWAFNWTSPKTAGSIYFFVTVIAGVNDSATHDLMRQQKYKLTTTAFVPDTSTTDVTDTSTTDTTGMGIFQPHNAEEAGIMVFPNPVKDQLNLAYAAPLNQPVKADMYDLDGHLVMPLFEATGAGHSSRSFNVSNLNSGIYILRLVIGSQSYFKKILVEN